jgi:flavin reductase (DIM6/NTAB) family NADH-FMN oxidoreductase RutF
VPSADVGHISKEGCLHAAGAELVHPEGCLMLQGCAAWVEGEVHAVVEQTTEGGHVEVREAHKAS